MIEITATPRYVVVCANAWIHLVILEFLEKPIDQHSRLRA
jgi:hypothetical protein